MSVATCDSMMGAGLFAFENARCRAPALITAALIVSVPPSLVASATAPCPALSISAGTIAQSLHKSRPDFQVCTTFAQDAGLHRICTVFPAATCPQNHNNR